MSVKTLGMLHCRFNEDKYTGGLKCRMNKETGKTLLNLGLIITSFVLILYGIHNNEVVTVFNKAINICLECIGIG